MIDTLITTLENTKIHIEGLSANEINGQAISLCEHLIWCLKQSDDQLLSTRLLNDLNSPINSAHANRSNPDTVIAQLLIALKIMPVPLNRSRPKSESQKLIQSLKQETSVVIEELKDQKTNLESDLKQEESKLAGLQKSLEASNKKIDDQAARLDTLVEQAQTSFDKKRTEISKENADFLANLKSELESLLENETDNISQLINAQKARIGLREEIADNHIEKLEELLGLAGDKTLTRDYSKIANEEGGAVLWWSLAAIGFFSLGLVFSAIVVWKYGLPPEMNIPALVSRIAIPFSALVPGLYCATKASGHRKAQTRLRNTGVRLATLEPFLLQFEEAEKHEIRKGLLDEFFKQKQEIVDKRPIFGFSQKSLLEIMKTLKE